MKNRVFCVGTFVYVHWGGSNGARPLIKAAAQWASFMKMSFPHLNRSLGGEYTTLLSNLDYTLTGFHLLGDSFSRAAPVGSGLVLHAYVSI